MWTLHAYELIAASNIQKKNPARGPEMAAAHVPYLYFLELYGEVHQEVLYQLYNAPRLSPTECVPADLNGQRKLLGENSDE